LAIRAFVEESMDHKGTAGGIPGNLLTTAMAVMPHTEVSRAFASVNRPADALKTKYL